MSNIEIDDLKNRGVSVIGAARSGIDAALVLARLGAQVLLSDTQSAEQIGEERLAPLDAEGILFRSHTRETPEAALPEGTALVVTSPGVPRHAPVLRTAVARGIPVWSEIELAYRLSRHPIIAITGTNGKTTTTLLIAHILQSAGRIATVAGNISADEIKRTLVSAAYESRNTPQSEMDRSQLPLIVAEISSFQLEWVEKFAPKVAILTNVTPDHLNRHATFEEYVETKAHIFAAQTPDDWAVVNYDNAASRQVGETALPGRRVWFTRQPELQNSTGSAPSAWIEDGLIQARMGNGCAVVILSIADLPPTLPGTHSLENVMAATLAALAVGVPAERIGEGVRSFPGVAHRMEWVRDLDRVRYINNSMCTNVAAAISSLLAMDRPTIAIMGGADKELDFTPLTPALHERAKEVVLIGQVADKMEATFRAGGYTRLRRVRSLEEGVELASQLAQPGEAVLLLPACASFDMFRDFEERGLAFRHAVHALK